MAKREFLDEAPDTTGLSYLDGFRFGFGFCIAFLVWSLLVGGVVWAVLALLHR